MTAAPSACHQCGIKARASARFCDSCGASLAPTGDAEYKQVTVLFADVVRSMDLAAALGPERLREVMANLVNRCAEVVQKFGGTLNQFTGDGIMALFGAPQTLEDHARRACLAALSIQVQTQSLAAELAQSDGLVLELRVGLNSGLVIAGDVGSAPIAYTATGQQVGMAQRMESVAPPGGVVLSESTAALVKNDFALGEPELVRIKGFNDLIPARRLLSVASERRTGRRDARLVGREAETKTIANVLDRSIKGSGSIVTVSGPPGIGKTRLVHESVATAKTRGFDVFSTYCESHTREISFHVISRLLGSMFGIVGLSPQAARSRVRSSVCDASPEDLLSLDELLGIRDTDVPLSDISPDARRRRLIELIKKESLARLDPAVYVIEDAHWIDSVSESMLTDFSAAVSRMRATMLITYRPEYQGTLADVPGVDAIALVPLSDSHIGELLGELLGAHSSVERLSAVVADRAAGIPFCAEEIVHDLAERGELEGDPGAYVCVREVGDVHVPPTLQAAIGARIDRLTPIAKRTLNAAAVIGARFRADLLERLLGSVDLTPLLDGEFVDQVGFDADAEYAFHHPLTQKVAYESQLMATRSELHRRAATIMQQGAAAGTGEGAAIIATQYDAAGDIHDAYDWYMRAATAYGTRDLRAARRSWELARRVADRLPAGAPDRLGMQITPRSLLCGSAFQVGGAPEDTGFSELRDLTTAAGDKRSLAVGMTGHITTLAFNSRHREAAGMASEFATLVDSMGDPVMTVGLLYAAAQAKWEAGEVIESMRLAQLIIDLADGDLTKGNFLIGSPLSWATAVKGAARMSLGQPGWRRDVQNGIGMATSFDTNTRALAQLYRYAGSVQNGAVLPTATDIAVTTEFVEIAERSGDNTAVTFSHINRAATLLHSPAGDRQAGMAELATAREMLEREKLTLTLRRMTDIELARDFAMRGDLGRAIDMSERVLRDQADTGEMVFRGPATTVLVEALLRRGSSADLGTARHAVDELEAVPTDPGFVLHELPILRLRALLAQDSGDEEAYQRLLACFREKALAADFEGYLAQADA
jgi:adenylate cyclase